MNSENSVKTRKLVLLAVLTAVIVVLQVITQFIKPGFFPITLSLTPIVVGAALCGAGAGAFLGFVFSVMVLLDPATGAFLAVSIPGTVITVILKGTLAGFVSGLVYRLLEKKNEYVAAVGAGIVSPLVNTGIFFIGCLVFFADYCVQVGESVGLSGSVFYMIATVFIGANFFIELAVNVVLSGVIVMLVKNGRKILKLAK